MHTNYSYFIELQSWLMKCELAFNSGLRQCPVFDVIVTCTDSVVIDRVRLVKCELAFNSGLRQCLSLIHI